MSGLKPMGDKELNNLIRQHGVETIADNFIRDGSAERMGRTWIYTQGGRAYSKVQITKILEERYNREQNPYQNTTERVKKILSNLKREAKDSYNSQKERLEKMREKITPVNDLTESDEQIKY